MNAGLGRPARCRGLVLLALLLFVALSSLWVALACDVWATVRQREREEELLYVGEQYRQAIESYWRRSPGAVKSLPTSLEALLVDDRFPMPVHHLRQIYADPITGGELALVRNDSGIIGVYSTSKDVPRKAANFPPRYQHFSEAESYEQWRFMYLAARPAPRSNPPKSTRDNGFARQLTDRTTP